MLHKIIVVVFFFALQYVTVTKASCPNWCSNHGLCTSPKDGGYCICENGYGGDDCSIHMCPKAFDPITLPDRTFRRTIRFKTTLTEGRMYGKMEFSFGGSSVFLEPDAQKLTTEACTYAFGSLTTATVSCERESYTETGAGSYILKLISFPLRPMENNLFTHDGNPLRSAFQCNTTLVNHLDEGGIPPLCEIFDIDPPDEGLIPLYSECSNHGSCNSNTGECKCNRGFYGDACFETVDAGDKFVHMHDGPFFSGTLVKMDASRTASSEFNIMQTQVNGRNVTTMRGDGLLHHVGNAAVVGGVSVMHSDSQHLGAGEGVGAGSQAKKDALCANNNGNHCENDVMFLSSNVGSKPATVLRSQLVLDSEVLSHDTDSYHYRAFNNEDEVASINNRGDLYAAGNLIVGSRLGETADTNTLARGERIASFSVVDGHATMQHATVSSSLDVQGTATIEDSLLIGSGFALTPDGMTVDVSSHSGTLFDLRSRQAAFNGSLLEIHAEGRDSTMIKTTVNDVTTFELSSSGHVQMQGLHLASGGIEVLSGGVQVHAGGLSVDGGLTVASGSIDLSQASLGVSQLKITSSASSGGQGNGGAIVAHIDNPDFVGSVVDISTNSIHPNDHTMLRIRHTANTGESTELLTVGGNGNLKVAKRMEVGGDLHVASQTLLHGGVSFSKVSVSAGVSITIPSGAVYVTITDDGKEDSNLLAFPSDDLSPGQVLIVSNLDADATAGPSIPPGSTVLFVYDTNRWVDVQSLHSPMSSLKGVQVLEAANDLSIGANVTFETGKLRVSQLPRYSIPVVGMGGLLLGSEKFVFNAKGVLVTPAIKAAKLAGDMDVGGNTLRNAVLVDSKIANVSISTGSFTFNPGSDKLKTGLAYLDTQGRMTVAKGLTLREDDSLVISDLHGDINMHGHSISNTTLENVHSVSAESIKANEIVLAPDVVEDSGAKVHNGHILLVDETGKLTHPRVGSGFLSIKDDIVQIPRVSGHQVMGAVDYNKQEMKNVRIVSGSIEGVEELSLKSLKLHPTKHTIPIGKQTDSGESRVRLLAVDAATHEIHTHDDSDTLYVAKLGAHQLDVTGPADFNGNTLKDVVLKGVTVSRDQKQFTVNELQVNAVRGVKVSSRTVYASTANPTVNPNPVAPVRAVNVGKYEGVVVSDEEGVVKNVPGVGVALITGIRDDMTPGDVGGVLMSDGLVTGVVQTDKLTLDRPSVSNAAHENGVLVVDGTSKEVVQAHNVRVDRLRSKEVEVEESLSVHSMTLTSGVGRLSNQGARAATLLARQQDGLVANTNEVDEVFLHSALEVAGVTQLNGLMFGDVRNMVSDKDADVTRNILVVDTSSGAVSHQNTIDNMKFVRTKELQVDGMTKLAGGIQLDRLEVSAESDTGTAILGLGSDNRVVKTNSVSVQEVTSSRIETNTAIIDKRLVLPHLGQSGLANPIGGVLMVESDGTVSRSNSIFATEASLDTVSAGTVKSVDVVVSSLGGSDGIEEGTTLVGVNAAGKLMKASHVAAEAMSIKKLHVDDHVQVGSLSFSSLGSMNENQHNSAVVSEGILVVGRGGLVEKAMDHKHAYLRVGGTFEASRLVANDLAVSSISLTQSEDVDVESDAVLKVGAGGVLKPSNSIDMVRLKTKELSATNAVVNSVKISGLTSASGVASLCTVGPDGLIATNIGAASTSAHIDYKAGLTVSGGHIVLADSIGKEESLLVADKKGSIVPTSHIHSLKSLGTAALAADSASIGELTLTDTSAEQNTALLSDGALTLTHDKRVVLSNTVRTEQGVFNKLTTGSVEIQGGVTMQNMPMGAILGAIDNGTKNGTVSMGELKHAKLTELTVDTSATRSATVEDTLKLTYLDPTVGAAAKETEVHMLVVGEGGSVRSTSKLPFVASLGAHQADIGKLTLANDLFLKGNRSVGKDVESRNMGILMIVDDNTVGVESKKVVASKSITIDSLDVNGSSVIHGDLTVQSIHLGDVKGVDGGALATIGLDGLLGKDTSVVVTKDSIEMRKDVVLNGKSISSKGVLGVVDGTLSSITELSGLTSVQTESLTVAATGRITTPSLILTKSASKSSSSGATTLVGIDPVTSELYPIGGSGSSQSSGTLRLDSLSIIDGVQVANTVTSKDVVIQSLVTGASNRKGDTLLTADPYSGKVIPVTSGSMSELTVTKDMTVEGNMKISGQVQLSTALANNVPTGNVKILGMDSSTGLVVPIGSNSNNDDGIKFADMQISNQLKAEYVEANKLVLTSGSSSTPIPGVLSVDSTGGVFKMDIGSLLKEITNSVRVDDEDTPVFPLPKHASFDGVSISGEPRGGEALEGYDTLVTRDVSGKLVANSKLNGLQSKSVRAGSVTVEKKLVTEELVLKPRHDRTAGFLMTDTKGAVTPNNLMTVGAYTGGTPQTSTPGGLLNVEAIQVAKLVGNLDAGSNSISNVVISGNSKIREEVAVHVASSPVASLVSGESSVSGESVTTGDAVMRRHGDGKLIAVQPAPLQYQVEHDASSGKSNQLFINGELSTKLDSFKIKKAELYSPVLHGAVLKDTAALGVSGEFRVSSRAEFGSDVVIGGAAYVSGTVMGSGPYVDSSDARLKKNITRIPSATALEMVMKLDAVSRN